ncbi:hypothetical protein cand_000610 [Cryptosporidium andersoni]|uniref:Uncharacterized protein n=1 Tax=Cryptosporidium andersoni TaxID=117008 RepID=A0A1J4MU46_9CRYT|nr:hypothetical protein cand_000610 [Cryptosporidium andersoni]
MTFWRKNDFRHKTVTKEECLAAEKFLQQEDAIMDEDVCKHIQNFVAYKTFIERNNREPIEMTSTECLEEIDIPNHKLLIECFNMLIKNYQGYASMCEIVSAWICNLDEIPDYSSNEDTSLYRQKMANNSLHIKKLKPTKSRSTAQSLIYNNMIESMALLIERYFDTEALRRYMDENRELLGQGGWQPPPCYWSLMKHPATVNAIQKLFTRNRKSEFLLAFLQDLQNFSKINPSIDCMPKNMGFSSTSNFSVFTRNVTELLADFLLTDETVEAALQGVQSLPLSGGINNPLLHQVEKYEKKGKTTPNTLQNICSVFSQSENAYFYAQALLHYMIIWRGDYSGCRRLSQMLYHYVRVTLQEPRVAQLNLLFTNITHFPELYKLCKSIFRMDPSVHDKDFVVESLGGFEFATKFIMNPSQICTLHDILKNIVERFEALQVLLHERIPSKVQSNSNFGDKKQNNSTDELADVDDSSEILYDSSSENENSTCSESSTNEWASLGSLQFSLKDLEMNVLQDQLSPVAHLRFNDQELSSSENSQEIKNENLMDKEVTNNSKDCNFNSKRYKPVINNVEDTTNKGINESKFHDETIFDMPSVSRMGDIPGSDNIQRLKIGPERPPMDALRESALLDTLIDILVNTRIWLTPEEQSKTIDLLLILSVYSPYELLLFLEEQKEWDNIKYDNEYNVDYNQDIWSNSEDEMNEALETGQRGESLSDFVSSGSSSITSSNIIVKSDDKLNNTVEISSWVKCKRKRINCISAPSSPKTLSSGSSFLSNNIKISESSVGCKSTIDSCIYRNAHSQKILGSLKGMSESKVQKMKEQFRRLRELCDRFKNQARKELFRIYMVIHDNLIKENLKWAYFDQLIKTPIGASVVLRYVEVFLLSVESKSSPLVRLSSSIVALLKHITQWHPKKRICVFHLLRLCLENDLLETNAGNNRSGGTGPENTASTKSEKRRWIIDFYVYLVGGGLFGAVFAYMGQAGVRYLDKSLIRDFTIKLAEYCGPPYSGEFSIAFMGYLVSAHNIGALDLSAFCDGTLSKTNPKVKVALCEIVSVVEHIERSNTVHQNIPNTSCQTSRINEPLRPTRLDPQIVIDQYNFLKQFVGKSIKQETFRGKGLGKAWYQTI